jgi:hypothetical protein
MYEYRGDLLGSSRIYVYDMLWIFNNLVFSPMV